MSGRSINRLASTTLILLIALCLTWELWLAPLRSGGSMLVLKVLPLLLPLPGILRGRRFTHQWASMLALAYIAEGSVRAITDRPPSAHLAMVEIVLAGTWLVACTLFARHTRPSLQIAPEASGR